MAKEIGALSRQPLNKNMLSQLDYKFLLKRAPAIEFFLQRINLPGINISSVSMPNPFVQIPFSGDHIIFQPLAIEFKVDEDFANYFEIHNWLYGLGFPEEFGQYGELSEKKQILGDGLKSDISLMILNSVKKPNLEIVFHDCFPTSLSDLVLTTTTHDVDYLEAMATFSYTWYDVNRM